MSFTWADFNRPSRPFPGPKATQEELVTSLWATEAGSFFAVSGNGAWEVLLNNIVSVWGGEWFTAPGPWPQIHVGTLDRIGCQLQKHTRNQNWVQLPADWTLAPESDQQWPGETLQQNFSLPVLDGKRQKRGTISVLSLPHYDRCLKLTLNCRFVKLPLATDEARRWWEGSRSMVQVKDLASGEVVFSRSFRRRRRFTREINAEADRLARQWLNEHHHGWQHPFFAW